MSHDAPVREVNPPSWSIRNADLMLSGAIERTIPDAEAVFAVNGRAAPNPAGRLVGMRAVETLDALYRSVANGPSEGREVVNICGDWR
jgi:hypothetical protein